MTKYSNNIRDKKLQNKNVTVIIIHPCMLTKAFIKSYPG